MRVAIASATGPAPALGLGLDPDGAPAALSKSDSLRAVGVAHLSCHYDPRRGHDRAALAATVEVACALNATPWLEAVVAEVDGFEAELAALGRTAVELGSPFPVVLVSPAAELKCTLLGSAWPPHPPARDVHFRALSSRRHVQLFQ
jgi:hypothetical protein